jgi:alpha-ribazole phosphatase
MTEMLPQHIGLLRHGEIAGHPALYGRSDPPLSADAMRAYQPLLVSTQLPWQRILCSPRLRCRQVADAVVQQFGLPIEIWPELAEMNFGRWDGVPYAQLVTEWPRLERFWSDPLHCPLPEAESLTDFHTRINLAWEAILELSRDQSLLIITHGGVIRMLLARLLHADWRRGEYYQRLNIPYASLTQLNIWHGDIQPAIQIQQLAAPLREM